MRYALLFWLVVLTATLTLGTLCTQFVLTVLFHHTIATLWAILLTLLTGDLSIGLAIVLKVLLIVGLIKG